MGNITVRNLPDETHQALRVRAAQNGRSTEAEVRAILEAAVRPQERVKVGSVLAAFGDRYNLDDLSLEPQMNIGPALNRMLHMSGATEHEISREQDISDGRAFQ